MEFFRFFEFYDSPNFRDRLSQPTSGLRSKSEVENMTLHNLRVTSIQPQSFIQIGPRVSEILQVPPKLNAILVRYKMVTLSAILLRLR